MGSRARASCAPGQPRASPAPAPVRQKTQSKGEVRGALAVYRPNRYDSAGVQFRCGLVRWRLPWQRLRRACSAALGGGAFWISGPARSAEPAPLQARIEWQASVCGKPGDFAARVVRRTKHVRFAASAQQLRLLVHIEPREGALHAEVTLTSTGKPPVLRRLESPDCNDALDALALVAAIGIDQRWRELRAARQPARLRVPERRPPPLIDPEGAERGPADLVLELPAVTLGLAAPSPPPAPVRPVSPPAPVRRAPPRAVEPLPLSWAAGAGARLTQGVAPQPLLGAELWLRVGWERGSPWSPELGASVLQDYPRGFARPEGQADFALSAAALELCPLRIGSAHLRVQPCAVSTFGWLRATGHQTFRAHTQSSPWSTLGAGLQALGLAGPIAFRLAASAAHPLRRDRYGFDPSECLSEPCDVAGFHRPSSVVWSVGVGLGVGLP
ncbi:MAG: hypothetical protein RL033_3039 [Pseudomonadota bacterium]